jgi:hypothetical protein
VQVGPHKTQETKGHLRFSLSKINKTQFKFITVYRLMFASSDNFQAALGLYSKSGPERIDKRCDDQSMIIK